MSPSPKERVISRLQGLEISIQQDADRSLRSAEQHAFTALFSDNESDIRRARERSCTEKGRHDTSKYAVAAIRQAIEDIKEYLK